MMIPSTLLDLTSKLIRSYDQLYDLEALTERRKDADD